MLLPGDRPPHPPPTSDRNPARPWRVAAGLAAVAAVLALSLLLVYRARRAPSPAEPLRLPEGCSWVREAGPDCPTGDATAYTRWVTEHGPVTIRHDASRIELLWVPRGSFPMGSEEGNRDTRPVRRVRLDGFWIGRTEVTVQQWRSVMGTVPQPDNDQGETHPVVDVSWDDGREFGRRTGLPLPTEAQWEYAARGPEGRAYPWGNWWMASRCRAAARRHFRGRTVPVGSYPAGASWCGALDMAGNVWEWCRDWYDKGFYRSLKPGARNPECTNGGSGGRVLRGGSWFDHAERCASTYRYWSFPYLQDFDIGFRVAHEG